MNYRKSRIVLLVLVVVVGFGAGQMLSGGVDLSKGALPTREIVGVVDAAAGLPLISPIGIASVFGDFARATTISMSIPLNLDFNGFSVKFDGKPGALFGSFDAQLDQANVQVPVDLDVSDGMVDIEVQLEEDSGKGMSTTFQVPAALASPGIFEFPPATGQAIVTNFSLGDDDVIAGSWAQPPDSVPGVTTQAAAVGGVITIWCTGLGPVEQTAGPLQTGDLPPGGALFTSKNVRVLIGGVEATVLGSVLQATSVGLYQINAFVPEIELSSTDPITIADIVIEVDCDDQTTIASREGMTIAVREAPAPPAG